MKTLWIVTLTALFTLPCGAAQKKAALELHNWSGELNVPDPIAVATDEKGRVYVTSTTRRKVADLDIRDHAIWIADDVSLTSVEEKEAFLKRELAPGKLRIPRGGLKDHNKDGAIDWKDLTVHSERIYQLRDTDHNGTADSLTVFAEGFNSVVTGIAAGILYHDGWVYVTIAPDLIRLRDTNDDGVADEREIVAHGFGMHIAYAGHDMHGPRIGPDGRIYWSIGDKGVNVTSKEGVKWFYPHEGCVLRCEPDGSGFEVFAHGLRNVQEIAFNDFGDLFGVDNDADLPGERERLVYITERSDSGWRCGHQYQQSESRWAREGLWKPAHAGQPLFITPPLQNYSNGPAGFAHEPGTALGPALRGHFLLNQFPSGEMTAFQLDPTGASFTLKNERLIHSGVMGIGMCFANNGGLLIADWMGGYPLDQLGRIWLADDPTNPNRSERQETARLLGTQEPLTPSHLSHPDQRVRLRAQFALVKKGDFAALEAVASDKKASQLARIHAIWGLGQGLRAQKIQATPLLNLLADSDPEILTQAAKMLGDARTGGKPLISLLGSGVSRVRFHAAIALGKIKEPSATPKLLELARNEQADPFMRHSIVTGLAGCADEATLAKDRGLCSLLALARLRSPRVAEFLGDFPDEAERAIHDDAGIPEALRWLVERKTRRGLNACLRLGIAEPAIQAALDPSDLQSEALDVLLAFTQPPRLDRIDGHAHELAPRDTKAFAALLQPHTDALLATQDDKLKAKAVELLSQLQLRIAPAALHEIVADPKARAGLRASALKMLASTDELGASLDVSLNENSPPELRREALTQLFIHQPERAIAEAAAVLKGRDTPQKQLALSLLAASKDDTVVTYWLDQLTQNKAPAAIELDILEVAATRESLKARLANLETQNRELLEGGDVTRGRDIVTNHLGANCIACHTVEAKEGSQVGPNLRDIGGQKDRRYLLESLLNPLATVAPGYGLVTVTLKDGKSISATLDKEDAREIRLRLPDGNLQTLPRDQIAHSSAPMSIMPPMLGILDKRQIRDVVAYLSGLKAKNK